MEPYVAPPPGWGITEELWAQTPLAMRAIILAMASRIEAQAEEIAQLKLRVGDLETKLKTNSTNSSKPPSSDPPGTKRAKTPASNRKRGGQPGHDGHFRIMHEQPDKIIDVGAQACEHCGLSLEHAALDPHPFRHQVTELPQAPATVTEYRVHEKQCLSCGHANSAALPHEIAGSSFGPRLEATVGLLAGRYRMSHREIQEYLRDQWNIVVGLGSIPAMLRRVDAALTQPANEAWQHVRHANVRYIDETGWRECNKKSWLWAAIGPQATAFCVAPTRGSVVLEEHFGEALQEGIFVSDRCRSYKIITMERRGICHAHLKRDFVKMTEFGNRLSQEIGYACLSIHRKIFKLHHRFLNAEMNREQLRSRMSRHQRALKQQLERGRDAKRRIGKCGQHLQGMCRDLLGHWEALWTFVDIPDVSPTNNIAERALRKAVLWRKGSFGTQSARGSRFVERILTVVQTCAQQRKHVAHYLYEAVTAFRLNNPAPALLGGNG